MMQGTSKLFHRFVYDKVNTRLRTNPVVAILGPRQVGKSTLAREFVASRQENIYLDLESPRDLLKLADPQAFLSRHIDQLVIIDEIQRKPELFPVLRVLVDQNRIPGRYLILGSASKQLINQSSESLAGRISYVNLHGLNLLETNPQSQEDIIRLWLQGGFPNSYLSSPDISLQWRRDFITTYLERDIPQFGFRLSAELLRRLLTMLAHYNGRLLNALELGKGLGVNSKTVQRYIDILTELFLLRVLHPFRPNLQKRLIKSHRVYIGDTGLIHSLLSIETYDQLLSHPVVGQSWEGFVINNILSILPNTIEAFFYRTAAGAEIDLVLKLKQNLWAIEIKKSAEHLHISKGYHQACEDIKATRKIVVYGGNDQFPYQKGVTVMSLLHIMEELKSLVLSHN